MIEPSIVVYTELHSITGKLEARDQRLSDLLNDARETVVRVRDTRISRHVNPEKIIAEHSLSFVPKVDIVFASESEAQQATTPKRLYSFVKKDQHPIFMILNGFEVSGVMHSLGSVMTNNIHEMITIHKDKFVPVTQARVNYVGYEHFVVTHDTIVVNLRHIQYIAQAEG